LKNDNPAEVARRATQARQEAQWHSEAA
jgi:hypothetical protein